MPGVEELASDVGLWWPAADEDGLRRAALAWDAAADALDHAAQTGRSGAGLAGTTWHGAAADRFALAWHDHERALGDDAAGCRALAAALRTYADAVADAKHRIEEMAVLAGASLVAGVGLAWLTFGVSAGVAAGVGAGLVAAAEAIGVELSATVAALVGATVTGTAFGAAETAVVDMAVTQPVRVEVFADGGYSGSEVARSALDGAGIGAVSGGLAGATGVVRAARAATATDPAAALGWPRRPAGGPPTDGPRAGRHLPDDVQTDGVPTDGPPASPIRPEASAGRPPADALADLHALDGAISAALDPAYRGALGPLFRSGVHETAAASLDPVQRSTARLLATEGHSVHPRAVPGGPPGAMVRSSPADPGRLTELARPDAITADAVSDAILSAGGRLDRHGSGDLVLDGRRLGLDVDTAGQGLCAAVERAGQEGLTLPTSIRFVFDEGSIHFP